MRRRKFIAALGAAAMVWPSISRAQQTPRLRRIGVLMGLQASDPLGQAEFKALQHGLQDLGWNHGQNVQFEVRWPDTNIERISAAAKELVTLHPEIIVARATPSTAAAKRESGTIPIVFLQVADPLGVGFVQSLARPGGYLTGFTNFEASLGGKWLELLKQIAPRLDRVAVLFNPDTAPYAETFLKSIEAAAPSFDVRSTRVPIRNVSELEASISNISRQLGGGIVQIPDTYTLAHRDLLIALSARYKVPAVYSNNSFAVSGGLNSYAVDSRDVFRRAADYVDRILKGAKPVDLPVQQPTKFELAINVKTAKALGLTVPPVLLARAYELIE
jgi:ABC-type uncharacterized transport system substrate-binding protein